MLILWLHVLIMMLTLSFGTMVIVSFGYEKNSLNVFDFGAIGNGLSDDSHAFLEAWKSLCSSGKDKPTLYIPMDKIYLLKPLRLEGPCQSQSLRIQVDGNIVAPNEQSSWAGWKYACWLCFSNVRGLLINGTGTFNGRGPIWWFPIRSRTPNGLQFNKCDKLELNGFTSRNSPKNHIKIHNCNGVGMYNLHITAPSYSPNTDGIVISLSAQVNIDHTTIGTGDDCIAIKNGSSYINITRVICGPGHGISVGSLGIDGANDRVEEVHVRSCNFIGTKNGARIKTWKGAGLGYAKTISFEHITLTQTRNPIIIDQNYCNPRTQCNSRESKLKVSNVTFRSFRGTSANEQAITLNCSNLGCTNILMDNIQIFPAHPGMRLRSFCKNAHGKSYFTTPNVPCLTNNSISG